MLCGNWCVGWFIMCGRAFWGHLQGCSCLWLIFKFETEQLNVVFFLRKAPLPTVGGGLCLIYRGRVFAADVEAFLFILHFQSIIIFWTCWVSFTHFLSVTNTAFWFCDGVNSVCSVPGQESWRCQTGWTLLSWLNTRSWHPAMTTGSTSELVSLH